MEIIELNICLIVHIPCNTEFLVQQRFKMNIKVILIALLAI